MDHSITVADLMYGFGVLGGIAVALIGLLAFFGAGMVSSPSDESRRIGNRGCMGIVAGVALFAYSVWSLVQ